MADNHLPSNNVLADFGNFPLDEAVWLKHLLAATCSYSLADDSPATDSESTHVSVFPGLWFSVHSFYPEYDATQN